MIKTQTYPKIERKRVLKYKKDGKLRTKTFSDYQTLSPFNPKSKQEIVAEIEQNLIKMEQEFLKSIGEN